MHMNQYASQSTTIRFEPNRTVKPRLNGLNGSVQVQVFVNGSGSVRFGWGVDQFGSSLYRFKQFDGLGLTFDKFLKFCFEETFHF